MGSHSVVTCHPTQVSVPHLNPSQIGWYSNIGRANHLSAIQRHSALKGLWTKQKVAKFSKKQLKIFDRGDTFAKSLNYAPKFSKHGRLLAPKCCTSRQKFSDKKFFGEIKFKDETVAPVLCHNAFLEILEQVLPIAPSFSGSPRAFFLLPLHFFFLIFFYFPASFPAFATLADTISSFDGV